MTNPDSMLKNRDITLPIQVNLVKVMVFPIVMYGCENWTVKKAEAKELMLLNCGVGGDRFLRVPWTARRSNQSIPKGDQSWMFTGRTDVEAETPILWPPDAKN